MITPGLLTTMAKNPVIMHGLSAGAISLTSNIAKTIAGTQDSNVFLKELIGDTFSTAGNIAAFVGASQLGLGFTGRSMFGGRVEIANKFLATGAAVGAPLAASVGLKFLSEKFNPTQESKPKSNQEKKIDKLENEIKRIKRSNNIR